MDTDIQRLKTVRADKVEIKNGFWGARQTINRDRTIPAIQHQLEITGRLDSWHLDKSRDRRDKRKIVYKFWDSDTAKWLEAVGYSLHTHPNPELEKTADAIIADIEQAQQPDGYLNTYFTVIEPENRWRNLRDWHEMYNAGHLIEAAVAYYEATGKRTILDVLARYADHIDSLFGSESGKKRGYPGHPELELALIKLYHATGEARYLNLAKYFVDERGQVPHYYDLEAQEREENPAEFWAQTYNYCQAEKPIREQTSAVGHSVRACYLYAGVADIAIETGDAALLEVSRRLWDDLTQHQMYITGGLGPAHSNEGFTFAYDLPNETAYAETCASCALVFWAHRMFHLDPNSRYIDVMERALYNTVLSGVSFDGDHFFYANPLTSYPNVSPYEHFSGITSAKHYRRSEWFDCPCCPPNVARVVADINDYFYSTSADRLYVHLYNPSTAQVRFQNSDVQVEQETQYPWDGAIRFTVKMGQPVQFGLALRLPGWCRSYRLEPTEMVQSAVRDNGYLVIDRLWHDGDSITLTLDMPVERIAPHPLIREDAGQMALQRGPIVYCLEEVDNGAQLANLTIPRDARLSVQFDPDLFGGVSVITGEAVRSAPARWNDGLYQSQSTLQYERQLQTFKAIPYSFWANRQPGEMRVWVRES